MRLCRRFFVYFLVLSFFQSALWAADLPRLKKLFVETWTSNYVERYCGLNIENLVAKAMEENIDLEGAQIVGLKDHGGWMFGMVSAVQARGATRLGPGEKNWYFHVFLLADGKVLDYDFTNTPKVLSLDDYLHEMYLPQAKWGDEKYKESKMKLYEFEFYPAEDYIYRLRARQGRSEIATKVKLKDYMPGFFKAR